MARNCIIISIMICGWLIAGTAVSGEYLGDLSANPYNPNSVCNPYSLYGGPAAPLNHQITAPRLYDRQGHYRGRLSTNPYDPDSISNPYGRYGSPYSTESINNPYGAGSPYRLDSPTNPYGSGWIIIGD